MQASNTSRIHEEFELESRHIGADAQRDESGAGQPLSRRDDSGRSTTPPTVTHRPSKPRADPNDAKGILLRKHVPLVVLPDFDQKSRGDGLIEGDQEHVSTSSPESDGQDQGLSSDDGNRGRGRLQGEVSHRSPSSWVATFFDVRLPLQLSFPHIGSLTHCFRIDS
jgi:hypothetical protein